MTKVSKKPFNGKNLRELTKIPAGHKYDYEPFFQLFDEYPPIELFQRLQGMITHLPYAEVIKKRSDGALLRALDINRVLINLHLTQVGYCDYSEANPFFEIEKLTDWVEMGRDIISHGKEWLSWSRGTDVFREEVDLTMNILIAYDKFYVLNKKEIDPYDARINRTVIV